MPTIDPDTEAAPRNIPPHPNGRTERNRSSALLPMRSRSVEDERAQQAETNHRNARTNPSNHWDDMHPTVRALNCDFIKDKDFLETYAKAKADFEDNWKKMREKISKKQSEEEKEEGKEREKEKFKAPFMLATSIKIGSWERNATHDVRLGAKFYFARKQIIWEVFEENWMSRIEMDWNDISAMKATFVDGKPDTLAIELNKRPRYGVEVNRQPKAHTGWKSCVDFTGGQATENRRHFLTFDEGALRPNYRNLVTSDQRLFYIFRSHFPSCKSEFFQNDRKESHKSSCDSRPNYPYRSNFNQTVGPTTHFPHPPMPPLTHMNIGSFNSQPQGDHLQSMNSNGPTISGFHDNFPVWNQGVMNNEGASISRGSLIHGENPMSVFTATDPNVTFSQLGPERINSTCSPMLNRHQEPIYHPFLPANANSMIPDHIREENFYSVSNGRIQDHLPSNASSIGSMLNGGYNLVDPTRLMAMRGYDQSMIPEYMIPQEDQIQGGYSMLGDFETSINGGQYPYNHNSTEEVMLPPLPPLPPELLLGYDEHNLGPVDRSMGAEQDQLIGFRVDEKP